MPESGDGHDAPPSEPAGTDQVKAPPTPTGATLPRTPRAPALPRAMAQPERDFPETLRASRARRESGEPVEAARATAGEVRKAPVALLVGMPAETAAQAARRDAHQRGRKRKRRRNPESE